MSGALASVVVLAALVAWFVWGRRLVRRDRVDKVAVLRPYEGTVVTLGVRRGATFSFSSLLKPRGILDLSQVDDGFVILDTYGVKERFPLSEVFSINGTRL